MNVLDRVQGCNRIIVQGHMEIEDQQTEGRGLRLQCWVRGGKSRGRHTALGFERQVDHSVWCGGEGESFR